MVIVGSVSSGESHISSIASQKSAMCPVRILIYINYLTRRVSCGIKNIIVILGKFFVS